MVKFIDGDFMNSIFEVVKNIIGKYACNENLTEETVLNDLGIDSLDFISIMVDVEEKYMIEIDIEDIIKMNTIHDLIVFINGEL